MQNTISRFFVFVQIVVYSDIQFKKYFEVFGCFKEHFGIFENCFDVVN